MKWSMNRRGFFATLFAAPLALFTSTPTPTPKPKPPSCSRPVFFGGRVVYQDTDSVVYDINSMYPHAMHGGPTHDVCQFYEMFNPVLPGGINRMYGKLSLSRLCPHHATKVFLNRLYGKDQLGRARV